MICSVDIAGLKLAYSHLSYCKVADAHNYEVADQFFKTELGSNDAEATRLENAIRAVESNANRAPKRARGSRPGAARGRGGRGNSGMFRSNWAGPMLQSPMMQTPFGGLPHFFGQPQMSTPAQVVQALNAGAAGRDTAPKGKCFSCGAFGHFQKDCPMAARPGFQM